MTYLILIINPFVFGYKYALLIYVIKLNYIRFGFIN